MAHTTFPTDLPIPTDDNACAHLLHSSIPSSLNLPSTSNQSISLSTLPGLNILFCYPRTGAPNETVPSSWNAIPGARGCTPQACSFRDNFSTIKTLGVANTFGISTQSTAYQKEVKERLGLPYELLSDEKLEMVAEMEMPTFEWEGRKVLRRVTLAVRDGKVEKVWYPVFPPDKSADEVIEWLQEKKNEV